MRAYSRVVFSRNAANVFFAPQKTFARAENAESRFHAQVDRHIGIVVDSFCGSAKSNARPHHNVTFHLLGLYDKSSTTSTSSSHFSVDVRRRRRRDVKSALS